MSEVYSFDLARAGGRAGDHGDRAAARATTGWSGAGRRTSTWPRWPSPRSLYFALREAGALAGFAIVLGLDDPNRRAHLKRIAVAAPGRGDGARLLRGLIDHVFAETETNRLDLDVFEGNERAKRAYESAGFTAEGLMREHHRLADGSFRNVWLMSILRREWQADRR